MRGWIGKTRDLSTAAGACLLAGAHFIKTMMTPIPPPTLFPDKVWHG